MSCRQAWLVVALVSTVTVARADTAQVETGERVYGDYCSSCHGEELRNTSAGVTFDLRRLRAGDQERFLDAVLNGKRQRQKAETKLKLARATCRWSFRPGWS
jgi:mono/diheme cytochrome c family protein